MRIVKRNVLTLALLCSLSCNVCSMHVLNSARDRLCETSNKLLTARNLCYAASVVAVAGIISAYLLYRFFK